MQQKYIILSTETNDQFVSSVVRNGQPTSRKQDKTKQEMIFQDEKIKHLCVKYELVVI